MGACQLTTTICLSHIKCHLQLMTEETNLPWRFAKVIIIKSESHLFVEDTHARAHSHWCAHTVCDSFSSWGFRYVIVSSLLLFQTWVQCKPGMTDTQYWGLGLPSWPQLHSNLPITDEPNIRPWFSTTIRFGHRTLSLDALTSEIFFLFKC